MSDIVRPSVQLLCGDALEVLRTLPGDSVQMACTSPPYYGLRDYGVSGQYGLEPTVEEYVDRMVEVFAEVRRVLRPDGTLWLNLGDSYAGGGCGARDEERWPKQSRNDHMPTHAKKHTGLKPKDLIGIPWRVALALQAAGWWLRSDIVWSKTNPMPESVTDRPTKSHEYLFLLAKSERYFYDADAIREPHTYGDHARRVHDQYEAPGQPRHTTLHLAGEGYGGAGRRQAPEPGQPNAFHAQGRNVRTVWTIATQPFPEAHFATFPEELVERCVLAGCPEAVCARCGTSRYRMVRTEYVKSPAHGAGSITGRRDGGDAMTHYDGMPRVSARRDTTGWSDCGCGAGWVAGTVLDPFVGSGTTAMVAARLGRNAIGIDLNPEYIAMAERRVAPYRDQAKLDLAGAWADG